MRGCVLCSTLGIKFIFSRDNFADIFMKPLPSPHFLVLRSKLLAATASSLRGDVKSILRDQQSIAKNKVQMLDVNG